MHISEWGCIRIHIGVSYLLYKSSKASVFGFLQGAAAISVEFPELPLGHGSRFNRRTTSVGTSALQLAAEYLY